MTMDMTEGQRPEGSLQQPQQKKKGGALKWVFIGGCGCLLIVALVIGLIAGIAFYSVGKYKQNIAPTVNGHAQAIIDGDLDTAYAYCSDEFKVATDRQNYEVFVDAYKTVLSVPAPSFNSFNLNNNILEVSGSVTTADGQFYPVSYKFIKKGDQWLIYSINIGG